MKKTIGVIAIYATLSLTLALSVNVSAQTPAPAPAQGTCTDDSKAAWYAEFTKFRTTDAAKAYAAGKSYLTACPTEEGQIPAYLKKWVAAYEKEARHLKLNDLFLNQKKYADALTLAKEILSQEPDYLPATIYLGYGGYVLAVTTKDESKNAEAITHAKNAIQAIESGKAPESWVPFKSKDDALGYLHYSLGYLQRVSNPSEALASFIKAAQFESDIKKNPQTYAFIAGTYESDYAKQSADYEAKYKGKDETPESKLAVANINQIVDRIIDSLARAVSVAGTDANAQASKTLWLGRLTELYKFRKGGSDVGLTDMIATVMSKPLPPVPTPLTTLPDAPAATATPSTGMNSGAPASGNGSAPATATTNTATTTTAEASTTKPAPKPKTRNNHRQP